MLFTSNLEQIIYDRYKIIGADELIVISGYLGPSVIRRFSTLPIPMTIIYGMYATNHISRRLHDRLVELNHENDQLNIYYSQLPVHAKCYLWKRENEIIHVLVGSANFTTNGLSTPFREVLAETTRDTFDSLNQYFEIILKNSIICTSSNVDVTPLTSQTSIITPQIQTDICSMTWLDPRTNETHNDHGLNWGVNNRNHTRINDVNIPIRTIHIRNYPLLFPPKKSFPISPNGQGRSNRHNDSVEIIWDDGTTMAGLFEGSCRIDGRIYPKQISSFPQKDELGKYIRRRLNVPLGQRIWKRDLDTYGRTHIDVSLVEEGIYLFDFS